MEKINFDVIFKTNLKQIENALKDLRKAIKQLQKIFIEIDIKPPKNISKKITQELKKKEIGDMVKELQREVEKEQKEKLEKDLLRKKEKERKEINRILKELQKEIEKEEREKGKRFEETKKDLATKLKKPPLESKLIPKDLQVRSFLSTYGILPDQFKGVLKPLENLALGFKKAGIEKDKFRDNLKTLSPNFSELEKRAQRGLNSIKRDFRDLSFELGMLAFHLFILFSEFSNILRGFENFANKVLEVGGEVQLLERRLQSLFRTSNVGMSFVSKSLSDFIALSIQTPVTLRDIIDSFTQMKAVGLDSVDVLKLTIDTAVAFGKDVSQIADDIARAIEGDAIAYKNLRNSIGLTNLRLKELGGVLDSSGRLFLRNSEAVEKNAQAVITYLTRFKGTAENTLGTIPQLLSNIEDAFVSLNKQVLDSNESLKILLTLLQEGLVRLASDRSPINTAVVGIMEFITNVGVLQKAISPLNNSIGTLILTLTSLTTAMSTTLFTTNELVMAPERIRERIQALDRDIALLGDSNNQLKETLRNQRKELEGVFNTINKYLPSISKNFNSFISLMDKFFLPIIFLTQRLLSIVFVVNLVVLALSALAAIWDSITRSFREKEKTINQINDSFKKLGDLVRDTDKMAFISFREEVDKSNKILDEFNSKLKEVEGGKEIQIFLDVISDKKTAELIDFLVRTKVKSFNIKINEDVLDTLRSFKQNVEGIVDATNKLNKDIKIKVDTSGIDELSNKLKSLNKNLNEIEEKDLINLVKSFKLLNYETINYDKILNKLFTNFNKFSTSKVGLPSDIRDNIETIKEITERLKNIGEISKKDLEGYEDILKKIGKEVPELSNITNSLINIIKLREKELKLQEELIKSIEISIQKQKDFYNLILGITKARIRDSLVDTFREINKEQKDISKVLLYYIDLENELINLEERRINILGEIEEKNKEISELQKKIPDVKNSLEEFKIKAEILDLSSEIVKLTEEKSRIEKEYTKSLEQINNLSNTFTEQLQDIIRLEYEGVDIFNLQAKNVEKFRNELGNVLDILVKTGKLARQQADEIKKNISIFSERLQLQEREKNVYEFLNKSLTYANSIEEIRNQVLVMRNFLLNEITKKEKYLGDLSKDKLEVIKKTNQIEKEALNKLLEDRISFGKQEIENLEQLKEAYFKAREDIDSVFRSRRFELIKLKIEGRLDEKSFRENLSLLEKEEKERLSSLNKNLYNELVNLINSLNTKNLEEAFRLLDEISKFSFNLPIKQMEKLNEIISKQREELIRNNNLYQALYNTITDLYRKGLDISNLDITFIDPKILKQLKKDLEEFKKEFADIEKIEDIGKAYNSLFERIRDKVLEFSSVKDLNEFLNKIEKAGIKLREAFKKDIVKEFFKEAIDKLNDNIKKVDELKEKLSSGLRLEGIENIENLSEKIRSITLEIVNVIGQVDNELVKNRLGNLVKEFSKVEKGLNITELGSVGEVGISLEEAFNPFKKAQLESAKFSVKNLAKQAEEELSRVKMELERQREEREGELLKAELGQLTHLKNIDTNIKELVNLLGGKAQEVSNTTINTNNTFTFLKPESSYFGFIKR